MMLNPRKGQIVQVWYRKEMRKFAPYHGRVGRIVVVNRKRPRNHGVMIGQEIVMVPCGHLRKV